jgi:CheY-like chemotaxis protein
MAQILLAESDRRIREFMAGILVDFGHDVTACEDAPQAAALVAAGSIDVLLTDLVLHDVDCRMVSTCCAALGIPTITLTGREFHLDQPELDRLIPLLEKPFRFDDLHRVLDAMATTSGATLTRSAA